MSKELDNVYEIKNAIKYLKGNPNIKEDSYSLEALYYIEQALNELEELKHDVKRYFHDNDLEGDEYNMLWSKLMKAGNGK